MDGKWKTHGSKVMYDNEWATVELVDVELPDGKRLEHHVVSQPKSHGAAGVLAYVADRGVLLIWRHRFITDTWTWEIPAGMVERKETPIKAAAREMLEETGWKPGKLTKLTSYQPMNGLIDHEYHCFTTTEATWEGPASDKNETTDISWVTLDELRSIIQKGEMTDGFSLAAVLYAMQFGPLKDESS